MANHLMLWMRLNKLRFVNRKRVIIINKKSFKGIMMNTQLIKSTTAFFEKTFGSTPQKIVLSPGRINIIGEHVDYNDGYVLPAAIDKIICFAFEKTNSKTSKIVAIDLGESFEINVEEPLALNDAIWTNYFRGVL